MRSAENVEMAMPEESGGSAIAWLMYALAVYWIASSWRAHLAGMVAIEDVRRERDNAVDAQAAASLPEEATRVDLDALVSEILRRETAATIDAFLARTLDCYETIIAAFNSGDRETLGRLVSPDVYKAFEDAITDREAKGLSVETLFARIEPPEIIDGMIDATHITITVRFVGEVFNLSRNAAGQLIEEVPPARRNVDIWTFARELSPRACAWRLVATRRGA
jgi:predicted lipid-binding transport protein (Tim44 family)